MKKIIAVLLILLIILMVAAAFYLDSVNMDNYELAKSGTIYGTFIGREKYGILVETEENKIYCFSPAAGIDTGNLALGDYVKVKFKEPYHPYTEEPYHYIIQLDVIE